MSSKNSPGDTKGQCLASLGKSNLQPPLCKVAAWPLAPRRRSRCASAIRQTKFKSLHALRLFFYPQQLIKFWVYRLLFFRKYGLFVSSFSSKYNWYAKAVLSPIPLPQATTSFLEDISNHWNKTDWNNIGFKFREGEQGHPEILRPQNLCLAHHEPFPLAQAIRHYNVALSVHQNYICHTLGERLFT